MHFNRFEDENLVKKWCSKLLPPTTKIMFSVMCVCQSVCVQGGVSCDHCYDALDLTIQSLASDIWWARPQTCSNLFTWGQSSPHWCWHLVAFEAHMVIGWAVRILLECFLYTLFKHYFHNNVQSFWSHGTWFIWYWLDLDFYGKYMFRLEIFLWTFLLPKQITVWRFQLNLQKAGHIEYILNGLKPWPSVSSTC